MLVEVPKRSCGHLVRTGRRGKLLQYTASLVSKTKTIHRKKTIHGYGFLLKKFYYYFKYYFLAIIFTAII